MSDWLIDRMIAQKEGRRPRCWGRSSDALALYGVGREQRPQTPGWSDSPMGTSWSYEECGRDYPLDEADLLACELTYNMAPPAAQIRMLPVLREFQAWVREGLNRYGAPKPYQRPVEPPEPWKRPSWLRILFGKAFR